MKASGCTDSQISAILKRAEASSSEPELCREHGISNPTLQVARQVRRQGRVLDGRHEGTRGRELTPEEDVCERAAQGRDRRGGADTKVVAPSQRRGGAVGRSAAVSQDRIGLPGIWHQPELLPL